MSEGEQSFMGFYDIVAADNVRYAYFASTGSEGPAYRVDDLVLRYVPEPSASLLNFVALACLSVLARRPRQTP